MLALVQAGCGRPGGEEAAADRPIATDSSRLAVDGGQIWYRVTGTGEG